MRVFCAYKQEQVHYAEEIFWIVCFLLNDSFLISNVSKISSSTQEILYPVNLNKYKTRLTYNCAHLRSTKKSVTI